MNWYLRKADKTIYGPVDADVLRRWAADGRVLPDDEVSTDQQAWRPAPELAELEMDWLVTLAGEQRVGPLHALAFAELLREGAVSAQNIATHRQSGQALPLGELLLPLLNERCAALQQAYEDALQKATGDADAEKVVRTDADVEAIRQRAQEDVRAMQLKLEAAEARVRQLETAPPPVRTDVLPADALRESHQELSRNYERILVQLRIREEELKHALDARAQAERSVAEQLAPLQERAARAESEAADARRELAELEQTHQDIVRAYRELNDRYIRLRQQTEAAAAPAPASAPVRERSGDKPRVRLV